ncbi:MAG: hypothetical protein AVDCRST_MAG61-1048 [uncultured Friedmanniella sp.]|uniref:DUF4157 domain-containing protein n=1 Tax=uncultured Friedmanniella sp. TaxID=335381 RepID=A0A6J4KD19_9ACTN|nr:hypothetical protein [uncultured Friedmanniella sp.]CAA9301628.1 MAG: hypothetical protein AVDCRST_MAG61-1048 [uncultured Friedmanniella sp.]
MPPARSVELRRRHRVKQVGNLVNLSTPFGLLAARLGRARVRPGPRGLLLAEGYRLPFPVAGAFTVGNVVLTSGSWAGQRPGLLEHEERHSWQWFWWAGLPFLPAYGVCLAWSVLRTGDLAAANFFERRAGLVQGGYRELPVRPVRQALRAALSGRGGPRSRS